MARTRGAPHSQKNPLPPLPPPPPAHPITTTRGTRLLALCVFIVGLDVVAIRPRYADLSRMALAFGALFALTPLRNIQVGVPPPMIAVDMWSFFWCMVLVAAGAACSATAHFAYAEGTVWTPSPGDGGESVVQVSLRKAEGSLVEGEVFDDRFR